MEIQKASLDFWGDRSEFYSSFPIIEQGKAGTTDKNVIVTMITTKGIDRNEHSECVQRELTLDDLFC